MSSTNDDGIEDIEFPTAICSVIEPHDKHLIPGTWRQQCQGIAGEYTDKDTAAYEAYCDTLTEAELNADGDAERANERSIELRNHWAAS